MSFRRMLLQIVIEPMETQKWEHKKENYSNIVS